MSPPVAAIMHEITTMGVIFASKSTPAGPAENPPAGMISGSTSDQTLSLSSFNVSLQEKDLGRVWITGLYSTSNGEIM